MPAVECVPRFTICLAYLIKNGGTHTFFVAAADDRYLGSGETEDLDGDVPDIRTSTRDRALAVSVWIGNPFEVIY